MTGPRLGGPLRASVEFTQLDPPYGELPRRVVLRWYPTDPLAIRFGFPTGAVWEVCRNLVGEGAAVTDEEGVGDGDIRFYPDDEGPDCVIVEMVSPSGWAMFRAPRAPLAEFVAATRGRAALDPITAFDAWWARQVFA